MTGPIVVYADYGQVDQLVAGPQPAPLGRPYPAAVKIVSPRRDQEMLMSGNAPVASVVVCAYTQARWPDLERGMLALTKQTWRPRQVVLVIDHNPVLLERAVAAFPDIEVLASTGARGLSGARNTGVAASAGNIVVFLDDDAEPDTDGLERLLEPYSDPDVFGVGGAALPRWPVDRPVWLAPEFDWVVAAAMSAFLTLVYRSAIPSGPTYRSEKRYSRLSVDLPKELVAWARFLWVARRPNSVYGAARACPGMTVRYAPAAVVRHRVSEDRVEWRYFIRRCFAEGMSKRMIAALVGADSALSSERTYVARVLPAALRRDLRTVGHWRRVLATCAGLVAAVAGYARAVVARRTL